MFQYPTITTIMAPFPHGAIAIELTRIYNTQDANQPELIQTKRGAEGLRDNIYELTPLNTTAPIFTLPVPFHTSVKSSPGEPLQLCVDIRGVSRMNASGEVMITNPTDYAFIMDLALLTQHWVNEKMSSPIIKSNKSLLTKLFTRWLGGALITKLNIEPNLQPRVNVIIAYYWLCMTSVADDSNDPVHRDNLPSLATTISDATGSKQPAVFEIIRELEQMKELDDLIEQLKQHSGSSRFDNLSAGFIFTLVQFSWYGSNPIELCCTALEYPPIFMGMIYHAATKDGFNKTTIGRLLKDMPRHTLGGFIKSYDYEIYK